MNLIEELEMLAQHCADTEVECDTDGPKRPEDNLGKLCMDAAIALRQEYDRFAKAEGERMRLLGIIEEARDRLAPLCSSVRPSLLTIRDVVMILRKA